MLTQVNRDPEITSVASLCSQKVGKPSPHPRFLGLPHRAMEHTPLAMLQLGSGVDTQLGAGTLAVERAGLVVMGFLANHVGSTDLNTSQGE